MLFAGKTKGGTNLYPRWWCFLFGGTFNQIGAGYGWTPGVIRLTRRFVREGWGRRCSWWTFVRIKA